MSTPLGIASVTYVLKNLLQTGLAKYKVSDAIGGGISVSALPPDHIDTSLGNEDRRLNLFMYQVALNPGWRNENLPAFNNQGERINNPLLALDLHYFLTAYGSTELNTDILLGYGMQLFHETPVLEKEFIRQSLKTTAAGGTLPASLEALSTSELADQAVRISITPETLGTEEISKLWTAFQVKYRPSFSYRASVLLIESRKPTKAGLPVQERKIYAVPFQQPVITKILSQSSVPGVQIVENQKILVGYRIFIEGSQLENNDLKIYVSGTEARNKQKISPSQISFSLPDNLEAGIQTIQIIQEMWLGSPPWPHKGVSSNIKTFAFSPTIDSVVASDVKVDPDNRNLRIAKIHIKANPVIGDTQQIVLLLNEFITNIPVLLSPPESPLLAYTFQVKAKDCLNPLDPKEVIIPVNGIKEGDYLVRIQVDTAESPLEFNRGRYTSPKVSISI